MVAMLATIVLDEARRRARIFQRKAGHPGDAAAVLEGDGGELVQLDEDHARRAQRRIVDDDVVDMVGGGGEATAEKTKDGATAARRGDAASALRTR